MHFRWTMCANIHSAAPPPPAVNILVMLGAFLLVPHEVMRAQVQIPSV